MGIFLKRLILFFFFSFFPDQFFQAELDNQIISRVRRSNNQKDGSSDPAQVDTEKKKKPRRSCCGENDDLKVGMGPGVRDLQKECFDQAKKATEVTKKGMIYCCYQASLVRFWSNVKFVLNHENFSRNLLKFCVVLMKVLWHIWNLLKSSKIPWSYRNLIKSFELPWKATRSHMKSR